MTTWPAIRIVDTTLRDGSHAIAHRYRVDQVETVARALDRAGVWAIAVGHGDGLGASSIQYGRPLHSDAELLAAAAGVVERAELAAHTHDGRLPDRHVKVRRLRVDRLLQDLCEIDLHRTSIRQEGRNPLLVRFPGSR
jgi:hypothetical protein